VDTTRDSASRVWIRRLAWGAGTLFVLWFALEGGEYGTTDLLEQRESKAQLEADITQLRDTVASLERTIERITTDDFELERIAREEHGLVRGEKELLYRFDERRPSDSATVSRDSAVRKSP
jgi:cell division protein FtsB